MLILIIYWTLLPTELRSEVIYFYDKTILDKK